MNKQQRLKQWIAALALAGFLSPVSASAQEDVQSRSKAVALTNEAIIAQESGDLAKEKAKLEELLQLDPSVEAAKARLAEVNAALAAQADAASAPKTPLDLAAQENLSLFREVETAKVEAQDAASRGDFDGALKLLDEASAALPANTAGQHVKDSITQLKQEILANRDSGVVGVKGATGTAITESLRVNKERVSEARRLITEANGFIAAGRFNEADSSLSKAGALLPNNSTADTARMELKRSRNKLIVSRYSAAVDKREMKVAAKCVDEFEQLNGQSDKRSAAMRADLTAKLGDPHYKSITEVSPEFAAREVRANELLAKGRASTSTATTSALWRPTRKSSSTSRTTPRPSPSPSASARCCTRSRAATIRPSPAPSSWKAWTPIGRCRNPSTRLCAPKSAPTRWIRWCRACRRLSSKRSSSPT